MHSQELELIVVATGVIECSSHAVWPVFVAALHTVYKLLESLRHAMFLQRKQEAIDFLNIANCVSQYNLHIMFNKQIR